MDAVVKVGGSLQSTPGVLGKLCRTLQDLSTRLSLLVVPGGGQFADFVRELQHHQGLSDRVAHLMAILGMNFYGHALHDLIKGSALVEDLQELKPQGCSVFLPFKELSRCEELEPSWEVTSDAIAAWVSARVGCRKLVLIKLVDGVFAGGRLKPLLSTRELKRIDQSVVDQKLPELLERGGVTCWVVNGRYPERVRRVLQAEQTTCTIISPEG